MTEPNPFAVFFEEAPVLVGTISISDEDDGSVFDAAIEELFQEVMGQLAEQVPDDDEDAANTLMAQAVQQLMVHCFKAGIVYQHEIAPPSSADNDSAMRIMLSPEEATELVSGLVGNGAFITLTVNRGQE